MTTITIERDKVERWLSALEVATRFVYQDNRPECEAAVEDLRAAMQKIIDHIEAQAAEIERLRKGLSGVEFLIKESTGVYGLHLTGELSPWSSLRTGGEYETWLVKFDTALKETP